jgi:hypothetical protein
VIRRLLPHLLLKGDQAVLLLFTLFVLFIYQAFDAYRLAEEYNRAVRNTESPPW